jgi:hypothetical protein
LYTVDSAYRLMMGIRKSLAARVNLRSRGLMRAV